MMNINDTDDRNIFEQEKLYPTLNTLNNALSMLKYPFVICGSVAFYLQHIYLDDFPHDVDVRLMGTEETAKYSFVYKNICRRYGFGIDFLKICVLTDDDVQEVNYGDNTIKVMKPEKIIETMNWAYDYWKEKNPDKANKYLHHLEYLKTNYPELF